MDNIFSNILKRNGAPVNRGVAIVHVHWFSGFI